MSPPIDGPPPPPERCNGIDDDGDDTVDEGTSPMTPCEDGPAPCDTVGELTCRDGALVCVGGPRRVGPERCNALDDDCDGTTDEGFDVGSPCQVGDGICQVDARIACTGDGAAACDAEARDDLRRDEACDGFDDDCDGTVDEDDAGGRALTEACVDDREDGECRRGERTCVAAAGSGAATWTPCASVVSPEDTDLCNGRDEDCDGTVDNGFAIGQPCDLALEGGGLCVQRGAFACSEDGLRRECRPRPEQLCDGLDNNCDGVVDDGPACADAILRDCRVTLGWATRPIDSPSFTWGTCPGAPELAADLSCNSASAGDFGELQLGGDLDADGDRLGVRFGCLSVVPGVVYTAARCRLYLGVARAESAPPDGAASWSGCPAAPVAGDADAACTSGDGEFRPMPIPFDLDEGAVLGAAFRCDDPTDPDRAAAMAGAVEVFIAWADSTVDDPAIDWEAVCAPGGDGDARTACVSTGGDGRFHAMPFTADVDAGDRLAIGLRPRTAP
ncbi:MAG: hypothetical protein H6701_12185 [Myxococcales bacterium]|nr:hypothetical protein [Myxococcales bacterium]